MSVEHEAPTHDVPNAANRSPRRIPLSGRAFKLTIAYDGTNYCGWQYQINGPSIQAAFEAALAKVTSERIRVTASGRTDSGVHAIGQVISFVSNTTLDADKLLMALNSELPEDIVVHQSEQVELSFHAIREARRKRYRYVLQDGRSSDIFRRQYSWHIPQQLDVALMDQAAQAWAGTHDFSAFQATGSQRLSTVRTVNDLFVRRSEADVNTVEFEIEADGFLYNMVRTMVGTLVQIGRHRKPVEWAAEVLAGRSRREAGIRAPAGGLFLVSVTY
ncbi:MAG: tRNA pseudouridine(38-40) synthase TruA [Planctomycetes bacterium]|nr:tRNA pseudouridine(38-40) synthase TruA [Planctomycetota bacterium]